MIQGLLLPGNGGQKDFPNGLFPPQVGDPSVGGVSLRVDLHQYYYTMLFFFKYILFIKPVRHGRGKREKQSENGFSALFTDYSYKDKFPWNYNLGALRI